jgi:hypothetical protein
MQAGIWKVAALCVSLFVYPATVAAQAGAARASTQEAKVPPIVAEFLAGLQKGASPDVFFFRAKELLWSVYPHDDGLKDELAAYVRTAPDGPGLGFAGVALIPFHDPSTAKTLLERILDPQTSAPTRFCFLNAAPYILAMGDGIYTGPGKLDKEARRIANELLKFAELAAREGLGRAHAIALRKLFDTRKTDRTFVSVLTKERPYGLNEQHLSAYLVGTLDLRDLETLAPLYSYRAFALPNLLSALSFAANRDFQAEILAAEPAQVTPEFLTTFSTRALDWWRDYLARHPSGDWLPAVVSGFREAGYDLDDDLQSRKSLAEILRAMESQSVVTRSNAYRLLNHVFTTHFDMERIFHADKYAFSFLEPTAEKDSEARLKKYWLARLSALVQ